MLAALCPETLDWSGLGSMIQGVGTISGVIAVVGARYGANAWREQKRAERRLEMAERVLTATHKARAALAYIRNRMVFSSELTAAEEMLKADSNFANQAEGRRDRLINAQAHYTRINRTASERLALDDCLPLARAMFCEELEKAVETLRHQFWLVQVSVDAYVEDEHGTDEEFTKNIRRSMSDVEPRAGEKNEVSDAIAQSVATIERICIPALKLDRT